MELDADECVTGFHPYPHPAEKLHPNLVNAALYDIDREVLLPWCGRRDLPDLTRHLFPAMLASGSKLLGYRSREYVKDAGTPERFDKVSADWQSGLIERSSLRTAAPALLLDRDGILNVKCGGVTRGKI